MNTTYGAFVEVPCINLRGGVPGVSRLKKCPQLLLEATQTVLHEGCDVNDIFSYGYEGGDLDFRDQLSQFLSEEYGDQVHKENVMMTAGATHGLHLALTLLISTSSPIYVIDPSYFLGQKLIQDDMPHELVVPVPSDSDGPLIEEFQRLIHSHQPQSVNKDGHDHPSEKTSSRPSEVSKRPYDGAVYLIPTFNNPRATSYSPERCKALVALARKHNLILISDDIYNLIYFTDKEDQPKRLLTYDLPSDPDYGKGHVLSNGSFSKILSPGVRLGWMEGPKDLINNMSKSMLALSGGAFNHYVGKLVTELLRSGKQREFLAWLRQDFKNAMEAFCDVLNQGMPRDISYHQPTGGFFIWLPLRPDVNGMELLEYCEKKYEFTFLPGVRSSPSGSYKNYVRLSTAFVDVETLVNTGKKFCQAYIEFLAIKGIK